MLNFIATPAQLAQLLSASRREAGFTQAEAAARIGVSQSRISAFESDASTVTVAQLLALCGVYGLRLQVQDQDPPPPAETPVATEW